MTIDINCNNNSTNLSTTILVMFTAFIRRYINYFCAGHMQENAWRGRMYTLHNNLRVEGGCGTLEQ